MPVRVSSVQPKANLTEFFCSISDSLYDSTLCPTQIFRKLDACLSGNLVPSPTPDAIEITDREEQINAQIDRTLIVAKHAYAAPWLLLVTSEPILPTTQVLDVVRASWRAARQEMLKAINRTSYRSILALYLFAHTPVPVGLSEYEDLDGLSGSVCIQTAVCHLQRLRARKTTRQFELFASEPSLICPGNVPSFLDLESRAHWAAMMWDTSMSLTSDFRTSLTSGLKGACSEPTWRLVKAFLFGSFVPRAEQWRGEDFEPTEKVIDEIVSAASICKTYVWKNITSLKEALREGVHDDGVLFAWKALLDAIDIFNTYIRPLLKSPELRPDCLDQRLRLKWYQVNLQYNLGILFLINSLEDAARSDLLQEIVAMKKDTEREAFTVLKLGLETSYTIAGPMEDEVSDDLHRSTITVTLIAIDPDPQYVVDCVTLIHKSIRLQYGRNEVSYDMYSSSLSILLQTLRQLPQSSRSVQVALAKVGTLEEVPTPSTVPVNNARFCTL
jgi:hypothetical protein